MRTKERLLSAIVDIQNYIKHDIDQHTCAACPRWDELQAAAMEACDEIDRLRAENERQAKEIEILRADWKTLRAEVEALRWRCVADEMPEQEGVYLCHFSDGVIETFPYDDEDYNGDRPGTWGASGEIVTHWMPLPEPPALRGEGE